jgi:hypothetical protein
MRGRDARVPRIALSLSSGHASRGPVGSIRDTSSPCRADRSPHEAHRNAGTPAPDFAPLQGTTLHTR